MAPACFRYGIYNTSAACVKLLTFRRMIMDAAACVRQIRKHRPSFRQPHQQWHTNRQSPALAAGLFEIASVGNRFWLANLLDIYNGIGQQRAVALLLCSAQLAEALLREGALNNAYNP